MVKKELNEVYLLRGIASLIVCLFHLILGNGDLLPPSNWLEQTFSFGYLGVEIFFILSGYVICYSLPKGFSYGDLRTFFLKRLSRIEPPYLISIIIVLILNYLSHKVTGLESGGIDIYYVSLHLAYLNNFIGNTYLNVVYWTLGIEFQFYVLIGLLFPLISSSKTKLFATFFIFLILASLHTPPSISVILPYLSFFGIGILLFSYKFEKRVSLSWLLLLLTCFLTQIYFYQGIAATIASFATVLVILFWKYANSIIRFFSMISFSLYLLHVPIGGKVINLGGRYVTSDASRYFLIFVAFVTSILAAYLFYKFVEKPAFVFSKSFKYKTRPINKEDNKNQSNTISPEFQTKSLVILNDANLK